MEEHNDTHQERPLRWYLYTRNRRIMLTLRGITPWDKIKLFLSCS